MKALWQLSWEVGMVVRVVPSLSYQELECNALWGQNMILWIHTSQGVENEIENEMKNYQIIETPVNRSRVNWKDISTHWQRTPTKQLICLSLSKDLGEQSFPLRIYK